MHYWAYRVLIQKVKGLKRVNACDNLLITVFFNNSYLSDKANNHLH